MIIQMLPFLTPPHQQKQWRLQQKHPWVIWPLISTISEPPVEPKNLSGETETILHSLPRDLFPDTQVRKEKGGFGLKRAQEVTSIPTVKNLKTDSGVGANVAVRRQSMDVNYELEKAYNALLQGSTEAAIQGYKDVLVQDPNNKNAMFGLATTYHKLGMLEQARELYGRLLELDPYNAEVLNNFLALVGEEAPESAILYLEQLKAQNGEFSPIYGQLAQLYARENDLPNAIMNMQQAVAISPENMVYKYNLAVLYDTHTDYRRAEVLYRYVLKAGMDGKDIPASSKDIQERLIYLGSK
jgi:Tfp pilus assembly protein PilF